MLQETWVDHALNKILRRKPRAERERDAEVQAVQEQILIAEQATKVIRDHEYLRHMALVSLEGMEDWRKGVNIRKEIPRV